MNHVGTVFESNRKKKTGEEITEKEMTANLPGGKKVKLRKAMRISSPKAVGTIFAFINKAVASASTSDKLGKIAKVTSEIMKGKDTGAGDIEQEGVKDIEEKEEKEEKKH